jgi:hypothetical protein
MTRSRIKKEEMDEKASEKASHPSWSLAITRKYWVVPKPFLARPHCPPLSPPFPPNPVSSRRGRYYKWYSVWYSITQCTEWHQKRGGRSAGYGLQNKEWYFNPPQASLK